MMPLRAALMPLCLAAAGPDAFADGRAGAEIRLIRQMFDEVCVKARGTAAQAASHALRLRPGGESGGKTEGLYQHGVVWTSFSTTGSAAYLTLEAPRKEAPVSGCQFVGFTRDLRGLESELARRFAFAFPRPDEFGGKAAEKCVAQARKPTCLRMTLNGSEKPEGSFTLAVQR